MYDSRDMYAEKRGRRRWKKKRGDKTEERKRGVFMSIEKIRKKQGI